MYLLHVDRQGYRDMITNQKEKSRSKFPSRGIWWMESWQLQRRGSDWNLPGRIWLQEGQGWPWGGKDGKRSTRLCRNRCKAPCPLPVSPHTQPDTCFAGEEGGLREVQSLAQSHAIPKGQSGTITSPHPVLPTANSPLRRAKKTAQASPAHFPSPHVRLLSAPRTYSAHTPWLEAHFPPSSWDLTQSRRTSTISYRTKDTSPTLGQKGWGT